MKIIIFLILSIFTLACTESINESEDIISLEVDLKMEVQILDSTYQLYSRPFTKIYFTTYILDRENKRLRFEQSDTTSCGNGWGVKELKYTLTHTSDRIVLGAANESYNGLNYREIVIEYDEIMRRIDTTDHASMVKTFAIYYR